ncbi:uncharacterized protein DMAD_07665 [Drosophila madeirensis]|uniref:Uncharacterized protein n=1 Tax=Drosophila madeirensis TaxID=30013 RepID=A0AAU9EWD7_DROMD
MTRGTLPSGNLTEQVGGEDMQAAEGGGNPSWNRPKTKELPSEIISGINVAIAQAQETQRRAMADTISGTLQEEFRRGFMELMAAITEAMTPLRQRVWEDDPNGREDGQTALECQKQSTKHRYSGEHQEQIPQEPPRKTEPKLEE